LLQSSCPPLHVFFSFFTYVCSPSPARLWLFGALLVLRVLFVNRHAEYGHSGEYDVGFKGVEPCLPGRLLADVGVGGGGGVGGSSGGVGRVAKSMVAASDRASLRRLDKFMRLSELRQNSYDKLKKQLRIFVLPHMFVFVITLLNFLSFYIQSTGESSKYFTDGQLSFLNDLNHTRSYYGDAVTTNTRVVVIVIDGLRYDHLTRNRELNTLLSRAWFRDDSVVLRMRAQLPSMSVPNWVTLVTGAPPEVTGVLGNLLIPETSHDSIFAKAQAYPVPYYVMRGITGSPWFPQIVQSTLPGRFNHALFCTCQS
jgi:hypothetical protein